MNFARFTLAQIMTVVKGRVICCVFNFVSPAVIFVRGRRWRAQTCPSSITGVSSAALSCWVPGSGDVFTALEN
jgi:hypothetical protein